MDFRYKWLLLLPVGEANLIKSCTMTVDGWSEFRVAFNTLGIHYLKNIGAIDINHAVQKKCKVLCQERRLNNILYVLH